MGLLTAAGFAPYLLIGLVAGVWVDRYRRRPILIATDVVNAVALATIPLAMIGGALRFEHLLVVSFVTGTSLVVANVAYQSLLPSLVPRQELVDANAALEVGSSTSIVVGPSVGGVLVQTLGAPLAIAADALSYLFSVCTLGLIRAPEPPPIPVEHRAGMRQQVAEGLVHVLRHPLLRPIMACGTIHNFFSRMIDALFVLFAVTVAGLDPIALGLVFACAGPGAMIGALLSNRLPARMGLGRTLVAAQVMTGISRLMVPFAVGSTAFAGAVLGVSTFLLGAARPVFNVNQLSLRQAITPDRLHGRVNATMRFVMWGVTPVGALVGGVAASVLGVQPVLLVAGAGVSAATLALILSPVGGLERQPDPPSAQPAPGR